MNNNTLEAAAAASATEQKTQKPAKAKRIVIGADQHLQSSQASRKIDNGVVGAVGNFRSQAELLLWIEKQTELAEEVVVVDEAGPLGFGLYRELTARGVRCYVCAPDSSQQKRTRRKNNTIDILFGSMRIEHLALSGPDMPDRRLPCPTRAKGH